MCGDGRGGVCARVCDPYVCIYTYVSVWFECWWLGLVLVDWLVGLDCCGGAWSVRSLRDDRDVA